MNDGLYNKTIKCPACNKEFNMTKVKAKACKVASRDSDFCVYYEEVNPIFYDAIVCENCGYAALSDKFDKLLDRDLAVIRETISSRWTKRSFAGERTVDNALEAFKLALYNMQLRKAKSSELAKVCIRIAWLYRLKKDEKREADFIKFALKHYIDTYEKENMPADKMDEYTCMYMIAELNRRAGNTEEAIRWFSKLINSSGARKNANLIEMARDQFQLAKENVKTS